jgi:predicted GIY-YIG superfamily endonuclease
VNPEPPRWHVYVLRNPDGKLYIGQTGDVSRRIQQHNKDRSIWTKRKGPWQLLWLSESLPASTARKLEMKLKRQKGGDGFYRITGLPRPGASAVNPAAAGS